MRRRASLQRRDAFFVYTVLLHPQVRGTVLLRDGAPVVDLPRLGDRADVAKLAHGAAMTRDLFESSMAMRGLAGRQLDDLGPDTGRRWLAAAENSIYHAVGTCRMGIDDAAVVDPQLRVHGIEGLRIVDASVMPTITAGIPMHLR